nr:hypothetical protein [Paenibacillus bovis]
MKLLKTFSFWFLIISIIVCIINLLGYDDKNLLFGFFGLDIVLYLLTYTEPFRNWIIDDKILWSGYLIRIIIGLLYGWVLDQILKSARKKYFVDGEIDKEK